MNALQAHRLVTGLPIWSLHGLFVSGFTVRIQAQKPVDFL